MGDRLFLSDGFRRDGVSVASCLSKVELTSSAQTLFDAAQARSLQLAIYEPFLRILLIYVLQSELILGN